MPRRKTNEEFLEQCRKERPDYTPLTDYAGNSIKMKFCHKCGTEFWMTPGHFLGGQGCPTCAHESRKKKLSSGTVPKLLEALDALDLSLTGPLEYHNNRQAIEVRCNRCGRIRKRLIGNILCGHGCKNCASRDARPKYDIVARLEKEAPEWELAGEYINARTPAMFLHKPCGIKCLRLPMNIFASPNSCQYCNAKRLAMSHEEFLRRAEKKTDYEILSTYINSNTKIHIRHKTCGEDFWTSPLSFLNSNEGCPYCKGRMISKVLAFSHEDFIETLGERAKEFEFLTEYKGAHSPIRVRHKCGYVMTTTPDNLMRRGRCLNCEKSVGEKEVYDFIRGLVKDTIIPNDRKTLPGKKELDVYLPNRKIAFEYDGLLFHSVEWSVQCSNNPVVAEKEAKEKSLWKTVECRKLGIRLIHIFEDEWIEKRPIVEDKIRAILKVPQERIFARKLSIHPITSKEASVFYEDNHIQGKAKSVVSVGLYNGDALVAAQSFRRGARKKNQNKDSWELIRYATKLGTVVIGGFSRCLKWFEKEYSPEEIVSFADLRICDPDNNVYERNGFVKDKTTKPDYYYIKGAKRFHKSEFRKAKFKKKCPKVYSADKTERQMAEEAKLLRIYDCGKIRYVKVP